MQCSDSQPVVRGDLPGGPRAGWEVLDFFSFELLRMQVLREIYFKKDHLEICMDKLKFCSEKCKV